MPHYNVTRRVAYPAANIYAIIADVGAYGAFLPLCQGARVWNERTSDDGIRQFEAELLIVYDKLGFRERLLSEVTCDPGRLSVRSLSNRGPVRHIDNRWRVHAVTDRSCDIEFSIDYQMSSRVLQFALSNAFDLAVRKIMRAFEHRAEALYGASAASGGG